MSSTQNYSICSPGNTSISTLKKPNCAPIQHHDIYRQVSVSPPETVQSATTSGVASFEPSTMSSTHAGSTSGFESSSAVNQVDLLDYMGERLKNTFDPIPLDRSLAKQVQTSGELNAKTRELSQLQALAQSRLASVRANFAEGIKVAKGIQRDLEWTQKHVISLNQRAQDMHPAEYKISSERYPAAIDC